MTPAPEIVFVRAGALGDLLLLRPAIHVCRQRGISVTLVAPLPAAAALQGPGLAEVQSIIDWESEPIARLLVSTRAARGGPDARTRDAVSRRFERCLGLVAFSRQESLIEGLVRLNPRSVAWDPAPPAGLHAAAWYVRALPASWFGGDTRPDARVDRCPPLESTTAEQRAAHDLLRRLPNLFLAVHPGSGSARKNWPAESFAKLVQRLSRGRPWLLVEGPADLAPAAALTALPNCVRAATLPLRVLAAVLARSGAFVGNDSGVAHLAAATGAPTLVLFGPTDPSTWRPLGKNVRVLQSSTGRMEDLDPALVIAAAQAGYVRPPG